MNRKYISIFIIILVAAVVVIFFVVAKRDSKTNSETLASLLFAAKPWPITPPPGAGILSVETVNGQAQEFYNGVDLNPGGSFGEVSEEVAADEHLALVYLTHRAPAAYQIVYDGTLVPNTNFSQMPEIAVSDGHFAYTDGESPNAQVF